MQFDVELSELAENQYDNILSYISNVLKNTQALKSVMIEGMYHELQDYENSIM